MTGRTMFESQSRQTNGASLGSKEAVDDHTLHNIQAEQALLGALLLRNEVIKRVESFLGPADFFDPVHAEIYSAIVHLVAAGKIADPITLRAFFTNAEPIIPNLTVPQYLGRLAVNAATTINVAEYARIIRDFSLHRVVVAEGERVTALACDTTLGTDPAALIAEAQERWREIQESYARSEAGELEYPSDVSIVDAASYI